ncbi:hypothetical protein LshimejAT787_0905590 [Lyophyllum shimeji]|uniref:DUF6534 domain-containing protein n=1 Tax=Lyophyllum shimeji TaxID=47721 RepID=A0A9P3PTL9_LYOSH|nr:hypothetical protein LshimejAT787_0905590 [Lyophyllum shimeji]
MMQDRQGDVVDPPSVGQKTLKESTPLSIIMSTTQMAAHVVENMGGQLIGVLLSAVLLGVSLVQTFYYYMAYPNDPWYLKYLVAATAFLDTAHMMMISHMLWYYLVSGYNDPARLERIVWSLVMEALCTGLTGCLVQCFYLTRVWVLSKRNKFLTGFILLIVLATAAMGTVWVILAMQLKTYDDLLTISGITISINALSVTSDVLIAGSLVYMLHHARTGFRKSDTMINKLMIFVVNTGVLTSLFAIAALLSIVLDPYRLIYAGFYYCIGRLYTNSFLATLNGREMVKRSGEDTSNMLNSIPNTLLNANSVNGKKFPQNISIRIDQTKEVDQSGTGSHEMHNFDSKMAADDDLDTPPRSLAKVPEEEYGHNYRV